MPLELEIIRAAEFIRAGAEGKYDLAASKQSLAALAGACRKRGIHNTVLDLRAVQPGPKPVFTSADLRQLVETFPAVGFSHELRLAILYRSDPHKRARLFSFLSRLHGWNVRAFSDFEEALLWLSEGKVTPAKVSQASKGHSIPIRVHTPQAETL